MIYKCTKDMSKEDLIDYVKELEEENKRLEKDKKLINSEDILNFIKFKYFSEIGKNAESVINDYLRWK